MCASAAALQAGGLAHFAVHGTVVAAAHMYPHTAPCPRASPVTVQLLVVEQQASWALQVVSCQPGALVVSLTGQGECDSNSKAHQHRQACRARPSAVTAKRSIPVRSPCSLLPHPQTCRHATARHSSMWHPPSGRGR